MTFSLTLDVISSWIDKGIENSAARSSNNYHNFNRCQMTINTLDMSFNGKDSSVGSKLDKVSGLGWLVGMDDFVFVFNNFCGSSYVVCFAENRDRTLMQEKVTAMIV